MSSSLPQTPTIADLFPDLSREEQEAAEEALDRYLKTVIRIGDRLHAEQERPALPESSGEPRQ